MSDNMENNILTLNNITTGLSGLIKIINFTTNTLKTTEPIFKKFLHFKI